MPSFTPDRSIYRTVTIGTVDIVIFGDDGSSFRVLNRGLTDLWVRVDSSNPAASADGSHLVREGEVRDFVDPSGNKEIRVTGTGACLYGIELIG